MRSVREKHKLRCRRRMTYWTKSLLTYIFFPLLYTSILHKVLFYFRCRKRKNTREKNMFDDVKNVEFRKEIQIHKNQLWTNNEMDALYEKTIHGVLYWGRNDSFRLKASTYPYYSEKRKREREDISQHSYLDPLHERDFGVVRVCICGDVFVQFYLCNLHKEKGNFRKVLMNTRGRVIILQTLQSQQENFSIKFQTSHHFQFRFDKQRKRKTDIYMPT